MLKVKKEYYRLVNRLFVRNEFFKNKSLLLKNVFKREYKKHVLISYVTTPFLKKKAGNSHSNSLECQTAAEIFDELGFCVDIIPLTISANGIDVKKYSCVYGLGDIFLEAFRDPNIRTIVYAPGCSSRFSRPATLMALYRFYGVHGVFVPESARLCSDFSEVLYFSDLIIPLGNSFVAGTYRVGDVMQNIGCLQGFYYDVYDINLLEKDFSKAHGNFLWFGSRGAIHKGLDIVLDVFKRRVDINLFVCGFSSRETGFQECYTDELENRVENIKNMGFLDINGSQFKKIMNMCSAVLYPSASEGGAIAILNVMANGGLIPIISRSTGLDVEKYGFMFNELSASSLEAQIDKLMVRDEVELQELSIRVKEETRLGYSFSRYRSNLKKLIKEGIKKED